MLVSSVSATSPPLASVLSATRSQVESYARMFVNQPYYAQMTGRIGEDATYYRPMSADKQPLKLSVRTLHDHLTGRCTLMFYAINPSNQRSKWLCVDADYPGSESDLLRIKDRLAVDGVHAVLEDSRRGGHLWVLFAEPLLAKQVRQYVLHMLKGLSIPTSGAPGSAGVEVYPRQDSISAGGYGNGVRGPIGVHRKDGVRYWFEGAGPDIGSQLKMLEDLPKLTLGHLGGLLERLPRPAVVQSRPIHPFRPGRFSIFDHFPPPRSHGRYEVQCPSCSHRHLAITVGGAKDGYYVCFNGCTTRDIREALGQPVPVMYKRAA